MILKHEFSCFRVWRSISHGSFYPNDSRKTPHNSWVRASYEVSFYFWVLGLLKLYPWHFVLGALFYYIWPGYRSVCSITGLLCSCDIQRAQSYFVATWLYAWMFEFSPTLCKMKYSLSRCKQVCLHCMINEQILKFANVTPLERWVRATYSTNQNVIERPVNWLHSGPALAWCTNRTVNRAFFRVCQSVLVRISFNFQIVQIGTIYHVKYT